MSKYILVGAMATSLCLGCKAAEPKATVVSPSGVQSKEVSFKGYEGLELFGTLELPRESKAPAVLLLPGSGPSDRDGSQPGLKIDILRQIAEGLAAQGIASLRFDKRAVAGRYAKAFPKDLAGLDHFFSWNAFVEDAKGAFAYLKTQPQIDSARMGILGHSEGGMIAIALAKQVKPKALILVSTPARDLGTVIIEQITEGYSARLSQPAALKKRVAETKRIVAAIRKDHTIPSDVDAELAPLFPKYLSQYMTSVVAFQPAQEVKDFAGPVLIVQGEKDIQVSPERDANVLKESIKGSELFLVKGASHCLKSVSTDLEPGFEGPVVPEALRKISSWAKAAL